jgi:hypothetical protein
MKYFKENFEFKTKKNRKKRSEHENDGYLIKRVTELNQIGTLFSNFFVSLTHYKIY